MVIFLKLWRFPIVLSWLRYLIIGNWHYSSHLALFKLMRDWVWFAYRQDRLSSYYVFCHVMSYKFKFISVNKRLTYAWIMRDESHNLSHYANSGQLPCVYNVSIHVLRIEDLTHRFGYLISVTSLYRSYKYSRKYNTQVQSLLKIVCQNAWNLISTLKIIANKIRLSVICFLRLYPRWRFAFGHCAIRIIIADNLQSHNSAHGSF